MSKPSTVVIADDDNHARLFLRTVLEHCGCNVIEACNGAETLEALDSVQAGLVILDVNMPDIDGYRLVRAIRSLRAFRDTPVLALTAHAYESDRIAASEAGFTGWLSKPVDLLTLRAKIRELLADSVAAQ